MVRGVVEQQGQSLQTELGQIVNGMSDDAITMNNYRKTFADTTRAVSDDVTSFANNFDRFAGVFNQESQQLLTVSSTHTFS